MLCSHYKLNQVLVLNVDSEDLTNFVNADHTISCHITDSNEDQLVSDALAVNQNSTWSFIHKEVTKFCDNENKTEFGWHLH